MDTRCSTGKVWYIDEASARYQINYQRSERGIDIHLHPYKCPECRNWHLTKQENSKKIHKIKLVHKEEFKALLPKVERKRRRK